MTKDIAKHLKIRNFKELFLTSKLEDPKLYSSVCRLAPGDKILTTKVIYCENDLANMHVLVINIKYGDVLY